MATYDVDYLSLSLIEVSLDSKGTDRLWWLYTPFDATGETLDNPSFEDPDGDVVARPEHWSLTYVSNFWDFMAVGAPYIFTEAFEYGWLDNQDAVFVFDPSDLDWLVFANAYSYDGYESGWDNDNPIEDWPDGHEDMLFALAADDFEDYEQEWPARHPQKDARTVTDYPWLEAGTPATILARLNEIKSTWNAHLGDDTVHKVADSTNTITSADATDEASAITLVNELWVDCWQHINDSGETWHDPYWVFAQHQPTAAEHPAADYADVAVLGNYLVNHLNAHFSWADNSGPLAIEQFILVTDYTPGVNTNFEIPINMPIVDESNGEEGYEHDWNNDDPVPSWPVSDDEMTFVKDAGTDDFDSYEIALTMNVVYSTGGQGTPVDVNRTGSVTVTVTGVGAGSTYDIQTLSPGSTTWVTRGSVTSTSPDPSSLVLSEGYVKARIYTNVYGSDSATAKLMWTTLEDSEAA